MNIITLDFETYFDNEYTLSKSTTEAYVRDPRFEVHGCSVRFEGFGEVPTATIWFTHEQFKTFLIRPNKITGKPIDWLQSAILCHHSQFDGLILNHVYGIKPAFWLDTLSMGRVVLGNHLSLSLANLSQHFNLPAKNVPYDMFKGKHWHELDNYTQKQVADGCCHDVDLTWQIFNLLRPHIPDDEMHFISNTIRCFTEPKLIGDIDMLAEVWRSEQTRKVDVLAALNVTAKDLGSDEVFANLLRDLGVEPELKDAKAKADGTPRVKYAFAKTDPFMQELVDDADEEIAALASARLDVKSTLQQTRSERLGWMASRGPMCVYLNHAGAHTLRDSGGDKVNWQNFTRGSNLGKAIHAPAGMLKAKVDKSQIECRILNYVARQYDVLEKFRNKEDPYVGIASQFYGFQVTKANEAERGTGKQLELSCGYGAGADTIVHTARKGTYGPPVHLSLEEGERAKSLYRDTHSEVTTLWSEAGRLISAIAGSSSDQVWRDILTVQTGYIWGPDGTCLKYPELVYDNDEREWRYKTRKGTARLYGAKLVENVIQWLARMAFKQDIVRIGQQTGMWPVLREHDAGTWLIPDDQYAEQTLAYLVVEMSKPPSWMPDIPLDAEGSLL